MNYKQEAIAKLAQQIKHEGFRVFIAKSGTYGIFCNKDAKWSFKTLEQMQKDYAASSYFVEL